MPGEETLDQYIIRRRPVLTEARRITDQLIPQFGNLMQEMTSNGADQTVSFTKKIVGMGRPYQAVDSIIASSARRITLTTYLPSEHQKSAFGFTDPKFEFLIENIEDNPTNPPLIRFRLMNNNEIELLFSPDGINKIEVKSWQIESPENLTASLNNETTSKTLQLFGMSSTFLQPDEITETSEINLNQPVSDIFIPQELRDTVDRLLEINMDNTDDIANEFIRLSIHNRKSLLQLIYDNPLVLSELGVRLAISLNRPERTLKPDSRQRIGAADGIHESTNSGETIIAIQLPSGKLRAGFRRPYIKDDTQTRKIFLYLYPEELTQFGPSADTTDNRLSYLEISPPDGFQIIERVNK